LPGQAAEDGASVLFLPWRHHLINLGSCRLAGVCLDGGRGSVAQALWWPCLMFLTLLFGPSSSQLSSRVSFYVCWRYGVLWARERGLLAVFGDADGCHDVDIRPTLKKTRAWSSCNGTFLTSRFCTRFYFGQRLWLHQF
jgi:hypothetical protein